MSLRLRLTVSLVLVFFFSLCVGGAVAGWHAVRSVRAEMHAALDVSTQTVRTALRDMPGIHDPASEIGHLVHIFDGDRHVQAMLLDTEGRERASSMLHPLKPRVPSWFVSLLSPALPSQQFDAAPIGTIVLRPDPRNEVSEVWTQLKDDIVAIGLFCGLSLLLTSLVVRHALRPIESLSTAFHALGGGNYSTRIPPIGPPELARLAQGVNAMAERMQAAQVRNSRLQSQILSLQEEERADLARDLHDEIGPFLFAVQLDIAAIEQAIQTNSTEAVRERARAIGEAVTHMQLHVRAMLRRLRPVSPVEVGLPQALENLIAFWRARRPAIDFVLQINEIDDALAPSVLAVAYRLVQESLSNAIRHGDPDRIEIRIEMRDAATLWVRVVDDGVGCSMLDQPGLGVTGMRERIEGLRGTLHIETGAHGKGLAVIAWLPCSPALEDA